MQKWYEIRMRQKAADRRTAEVFIYGDIGESWWGETVTAQQFVKEIAALEADAITVRINSYGGSVSDGIAIYNALKRHKAEVTTAIDGVALSIASLIAMAGDTVEMAENAMLMIHAPWGGVVGNSAEMREYADVLDKMAAAMASSYAARSGKGQEDMLALLTDGKDHWYTADEALAEGFVTTVTAALAIAASAGTRFTPPAAPSASVKPPAAAAAQPPKGTDMQTTVSQAAAPDIAAVTAQAVSDYQARAKALMETGKAYAQFGGVELAAQAVADGWSEADLNAKLLAAAAKGPAHPTYGQHARVSDNLDPKTHGFKSLGEFAHHVRNAALGNGRVEERLVRAAATSYANEGNGADGGFAVPPQFAQDIATLSLEEDSLLAMTDATPVTGNSMSFPKDETTPWGSTGIIANWEGEGDSHAERKPALKLDHLRLKKLICLVKATDELLADSVAMGAYLRNKMALAVRWKSNDAIINGKGAGQPLGILNGGSVVQIAKESGQAADTVVAANIAKMYARVFKQGGPVVWLHNPDVFPQIITLSLNSNPIWVPNNQGLQGAPGGFLLGRPLIETDACDTVGDVGDLILANMGGYRSITKAGGESFSESMHLHFDQDIVAYKLVFRMDGQPALSAAVTPPNSSATRSHFATIAARA